MKLITLILCLSALAFSATKIQTANRKLAPAKIWHMEFLPNQNSCPRMDLYLEFSENLKNPKILSKNSPVMEITMLEKFLAKINLADKAGEHNYSANFYLISNRITAEFISADGKCSGEAKLEKTRIMNAKWDFKFYPNFDSKDCHYQELSVQNEVDYLINDQNFVMGKITSGEMDELNANVKFGNHHFEMAGLVNFEWGSAKGSYTSTNCSGLFEAKIKARVNT